MIIELALELKSFCRIKFRGLALKRGFNLHITFCFQAKREYLSSLQCQIAEKAKDKVANQEDLKDESKVQDTDRKTHQSRVQQLREKKLQQLRYVIDICYK